MCRIVAEDERACRVTLSRMAEVLERFESGLVSAMTHPHAGFLVSVFSRLTSARVRRVFATSFTCCAALLSTPHWTCLLLQSCHPAGQSASWMHLSLSRLHARVSRSDRDARAVRRSEQWQSQSGGEFSSCRRWVDFTSSSCPRFNGGEWRMPRAIDGNGHVRAATSPCFALPPPPPPPPQLPLVTAPHSFRLQFFTTATLSHHAAHRPRPRRLRRVRHRRQHHRPAVPDQDRTPAFFGQQDELQQ